MVPQFPHLPKELIEVAVLRELMSVHRSRLCLAVPECPYLGALMPWEILLFLLTVETQRGEIMPTSTKTGRSRAQDLNPGLLTPEQ